MKILLCDIFRNEEFREKFKDVAFDLLLTLTFILTSTIPDIRKLVPQMSKKSGDRKNWVQNSTIQDKYDVVLNELGKRHVSKMF